MRFVHRVCTTTPRWFPLTSSKVKAAMITEMCMTASLNTMVMRMDRWKSVCSWKEKHATTCLYVGTCKNFVRNFFGRACFPTCVHLAPLITMLLCCAVVAAAERTYKTLNSTRSNGWHVKASINSLDLVYYIFMMRKGALLWWHLAANQDFSFNFQLNDLPTHTFTRTRQGMYLLANIMLFFLSIFLLVKTLSNQKRCVCVGEWNLFPCEQPLEAAIIIASIRHRVFSHLSGLYIFFCPLFLQAQKMC